MKKKILSMLKMRLGVARINRKGFAKIWHELDIDSYEKGYWTGVINCLSGTIRIVTDMEED